MLPARFGPEAHSFGALAGLLFCSFLSTLLTVLAGCAHLGLQWLLGPNIPLLHHSGGWSSFGALRSVGKHIFSAVLGHPMQEALRSLPAPGYWVSLSSKTETFHLTEKGLKQSVNSEWLQEVPDPNQVLEAPSCQDVTSQAAQSPSEETSRKEDQTTCLEEADTS